MLEPEWKSFERAVAAFLQKLEPGASVASDVYQPDADTGQPRQRDVWIEARVAGFPVRILVSCKHYRRKLNQQDIDAFLGELMSSKAHVGVIYSRSGFSDNAIEKGRAKGISCCQLYQNEPPDIPDVLFFTTYLWRSMAQFVVVDGLSGRPDVTWAELFNCADKDGTLLDQLDSACGVAAQSARKAVQEGAVRPDMVSVVNLAFESVPGFGDFRIRVAHRWRLFRARQASHAVNGSFSATDGTFIGTIMSPAIDTWSTDPGPGWEEVPATQDSIQPNAVHMIMSSGAARQTLVEHLGPLRVAREDTARSEA